MKNVKKKNKFLYIESLRKKAILLSISGLTNALNVADWSAKEKHSESTKSRTSKGPNTISPL